MTDTISIQWRRGDRDWEPGTPHRFRGSTVLLLRNPQCQTITPIEGGAAGGVLAWDRFEPSVLAILMRAEGKWWYSSWPFGIGRQPLSEGAEVSFGNGFAIRVTGLEAPGDATRGAVSEFEFYPSRVSVSHPEEEAKVFRVDAFKPASTDEERQTLTAERVLRSCLLQGFADGRLQSQWTARLWHRDHLGMGGDTSAWANRLFTRDQIHQTAAQLAVRGGWLPSAATIKISPHEGAQAHGRVDVTLRGCPGRLALPPLESLTLNTADFWHDEKGTAHAWKPSAVGASLRWPQVRSRSARYVDYATDAIRRALQRKLGVEYGQFVRVSAATTDSFQLLTCDLSPLTGKVELA